MTKKRTMEEADGPQMPEGAHEIVTDAIILGDDEGQVVEVIGTFDGWKTIGEGEEEREVPVLITERGAQPVFVGADAVGKCKALVKGQKVWICWTPETRELGKGRSPMKVYKVAAWDAPPPNVPA